LTHDYNFIVTDHHVMLDYVESYDCIELSTSLYKMEHF